MAAARLVARAREKGLPAGKSEGVIPAAPDAPETPDAPAPAVPPLVPPVTDEALIMKAVDALARTGDKDAWAALDAAKANGGRLSVTPEQAGKLVARAREKGLLRKETEKGPQGKPAP